jgi:L-ascorbate metabolism protein UlaG (beta-lactamase superfamily)
VTAAREAGALTSETYAGAEEAATAARAAGGAGARLTWLGHATVLVELDGLRVLTDPLLRRRLGHLRRTAPSLAPPAFAGVDLVLVSHVHYDHLDLASLELLGRTVPVVVPRGARRLLARRGFSRAVEVDAGFELSVGRTRLLVTHAEHHAKRGLRDAESPSLGYVLAGSRSVYFAGDTDLFAEMSGLVESLDVALLPVGGWGPRLPPGHLDPDRAAEALTLLRPRVAVPIHWGTYRPLAGPGPPAEPGAAFAARAAEVAPAVEVRVLRVGESVTV